MRTHALPGQAPHGAVPPVSDSFVGRERELRRMRSLLRSARLLTLVGPGGAGKSRLAVEFARQAERRGAVVRLVELDAVVSGEQVRHAVAEALGDAEDDPAQRGVLLVLDGCEHLVAACAVLADRLLRRYPWLRMLATSREGLRVPAEVTFRVDGLPRPDPAERSAARIARADAVRLFVDRATERDPDFRLGPHAGPVAQLCHRLDGLPLGIELAAGQLPALSPAEILHRLDDRLTLLSHPDRRGPSRHRELRSTVEWSYRLLSSPERAMLRRLSVLSGGFDLDAAKAVCTGTGIPSDGVLRLVCSLETKSLITRPAGGGGNPRFRQWECVRAYALDRLTAAGEAEVTRQQAAAWLGRQAQSLSETLFFAEPELRGLRRERVNLAAAVDHSGEQSDDQRTLLTVALARVRWQQQHHTPARRLLSSVLQPGVRSRYRGEALVWSALAASVQSDHTDALRLARQAVGVQRDRADPTGLAKALDALAFVLMSRGEFAGAVTTYRDCLAVVRTLGRPLDTAKCQHCLAWTLLLIGELAEAERLLRRVVPVYRTLASKHAQASALNTVGALRLSKGDIEAAGSAFAEVVRTIEPNDYVALDAVDGLAIVAARQGEYHRSLSLATAAAQTRRRLDITAAPPWLSWVRSATDRASARLGATAAEAVAAGRELSADNLRAFALRPSAVDPCGCAGRVDHDGPLSPRELQIAELVASGMTNREIADRLHLSVRTVRTHLTSIHNKLDLRSRTQIAVWTVRQPDLVPAPDIASVQLARA